ncbi:hypothetical protein Cs7R123_17130 [Catellatospora sp. TT07R-123]|nr:hypothetical protein Cs7R123_17130 [Catellatospora sp. TT07R-123]
MICRVNPAYPGPVMPYAAYQVPVPLPEGHGVIVASFNRGPYLVSAATTCRLKIDGRDVPFGSEGTYHIAVPAGPHEVKVTDWMGVPMIKTRLTVQPGAAHPLNFRFGGWRNRVHDGHGTDVTTFGMWSNYLVMLIVLGVAVLCCGGGTVLAALASSSS